MESALCDGGGAPGLTLIETLRSDAPEARVARHLARMARGAAALGWEFDAAAARRALGGHPVPVRLRLTLDRAGVFAVTTGDLPAPAERWRLRVAGRRLWSGDPWLRHKTTRRAEYDAERAALAPGIDEAIFLNERGEVCDGTITNVFFDRGEGLCTPPVSCGLLPGILREEMIAQGVREEVLMGADLGAVRIWVGNALRGMIPAQM